jgi:hypothetical protein
MEPVALLNLAVLARATEELAWLMEEAAMGGDLVGVAADSDPALPQQAHRR